MMDHIKVCGDQVPRSVKIKLLGTWLDSNLNPKHYINLKCRMVIRNLQKLKHIMNVLTPDTARLIVHGMVTCSIIQTHCIMDYQNPVKRNCKESRI